MDNRLDNIEKVIIKVMLKNKDFAALISSSFVEDFFDDKMSSSIFSFTKEYLKKYNEIPDEDIVKSSIEDKDGCMEFFNDINGLDIDIAKNYNYLIDQSNTFLKDKAIKNAILKSVEIIEDKKNIIEIRKLIEDALTKDLNIDLGLNYFDDLKSRLTRIFSNDIKRIPTYYPVFDEYINGGFPPYTFSVSLARIHGGKSAQLANFAARQVLHGHNVVLFTMEMSEDAFAQRFDAIYSNMDINKMYSVKSNFKKILTNLKQIKENENRGKLYIKQFPTGKASVNDLDIYLRELKMRGINIDIIYADYINLMRSAYSSSDKLYEKVKNVAEELRGLSFIYRCPVVSVSQLNREGSSIAFNDVDFTYVSESLGLPATVDFMSILGFDPEKASYVSEVQYKIVKNRLGGRVGSVDKFFNDSKTLKYYDSSEYDLWISDANITGDDREPYEKPANFEENNNLGKKSRKKKI